VGGMMGALHGLPAIPHHMLAAVCGYSYERTQRGYARPPRLTPGAVLRVLARHWSWLCTTQPSLLALCPGGES
jgi:hypothetical protein